MNPRDTQRGRLYDAQEAAAFITSGGLFQQTIADGDVQAYVDAVLARPAVRNRWGNKQIEVRKTHSGGHADYWGWWISLGRLARNEQTVLHEIAHCLLPGGRYAFHGPEFAGLMLWLIDLVLGREEATVLREQYRVHRVRKSNAGIPAPRQRKVAA